MVNGFDFDENENPNFIDMCVIEEKQGVYVKGKDVIHLDAPKVFLSKKTPLNTKAQDLAGAINELFSSDPGGGDDWQPPDWWIPVPEPEEYDIYILVLASKDGKYNNGMKFELFLARESDNETGHGTIICDWGDGTADELDHIGYPTHIYTEEGQYLIHITADENTNCWRSSGASQAEWQIVKTGQNIAFVTDYNDRNNYDVYGSVFPNNSLKYVQVNHLKGLPSHKKKYLFQGFRLLQKVELKKKISDILYFDFSSNYGLCNLKQFSVDTETITSIGSYAFSSCYGLKNINFPNVATVSAGAFDGCYALTSVYLPSCTRIDDYAFQNCYNLQEIVVAENCTFGTNCFQNCYSLYPRPDGSTN